jgi:hypothetical protein
MLLVRFGSVTALLLLSLACYFGSASARYIQADPIGLEGGPNEYTYVGGNPLSMVDPTGELGSIFGYGNMRGIGKDEAAAFIGVSNAAVGLGLIGGAAMAVGIPAANAAPGAAAMCYKAATSDPCKNAIIAAALGTAFCQGKLPNSLRRDLERRDTISRDINYGRQGNFGNQRQYP